jgi:hypothetical protein
MTAKIAPITGGNRDLGRATAPRTSRLAPKGQSWLWPFGQLG